MPQDPIPEEVIQSICSELEASLDKYLGEGAFKQVYLVKRNDELLALKVSRSSNVTRRSDREMQILDACNHIGISRFVESAVCSSDLGDYHYALEEYIDGGTLTQKCKNDGLLTRVESLSMLFELVQTLAYLRGLWRGLVHRDIKPDNIMFRDGSLSPVLVDFGLARVLGETSLTFSWAGQGPGSPYYSAPEQLNNEKQQIDWRTDQFALGVTFSLCLWGFHPYQFEGEDDFSHDVVGRVALRERPTERFTKSCVDNNLEFMSRMVQPWPVERFRRPEDLLIELELTRG